MEKISIELKREIKTNFCFKNIFLLYKMIKPLKEKKTLPMCPIISKDKNPHQNLGKYVSSRVGTITKI